MNAAAVVLQTHLGRAVPAAGAAEAGARTAAHCGAFELDLARGERGDRAPARSPLRGGSLSGFALDFWAVALLFDVRNLLPGDAEDWGDALATVLDAGNSEPPC